MNKIYSAIVFILIASCSDNKQSVSDTVSVNLTLKCNKIFYSEDINSGSQIIFQIYYDNPTDYTYIFGDRDNPDNGLDPMISLDATETSNGFVLKTQKNPVGVLLTHYEEKRYIKLKPMMKHYFYLSIVNRTTIEKFKKESFVRIQYNGSKKNLKEQYGEAAEKIIFMQQAKLNIDISLDEVKFIKVAEETTLNDRNLDKL